MARITPIDVIKGISGKYGSGSSDYFATNEQYEPLWGDHWRSRQHYLEQREAHGTATGPGTTWNERSEAQRTERSAWNKKSESIASLFGRLPENI